MTEVHLPYGNGKKIYLNPTIFKIGEKYVNEEEKAILFPNCKTVDPWYMLYKTIFSYLFEMGYQVITKSDEVDEDTFYFTTCLTEEESKNIDAYYKRKRDKIIDCLREVGMDEPKSINFSASTFPDNLLPLPFVLKNEDGHTGSEKYLIETEEQITKVKAFYENGSEYAHKKAIERIKRELHIHDDVATYEDGTPNTSFDYLFHNYQEEFHQCMRIQEYIETPTEYNTSLRVVVTSTGEILTSSLQYSLPILKSYTDIGFQGRGLDRFFMNVASPYYLANVSIVSNKVAGGNSIVLGKDNYTEKEMKILRAHEIDPYHPVVPTYIQEAAKVLFSNCQREMGAVSGMDFLYDVKSKRWKYIEEHETPMYYSLAEDTGLPYDDENPNREQYNQDVLDIYARLKSLEFYMKKEYQNSHVKEKSSKQSSI